MRGSATRILRWDGESAHQQQDDLAEEDPLEIRMRGRAISVTMRTPGHDAELAAGFLLTVGIIRGRQDLLHIEHCDRNEIGNILNVLRVVSSSPITTSAASPAHCGLPQRWSLALPITPGNWVSFAGGNLIIER